MNRLACLGILIAGCTGCPAPPPQPAVTVVGSDGSVVEATVTTACQNLANVCSVVEADCEKRLTSLMGNAPVDLGCASTKTTKADLHNCAGVGSACVP